VLLTIIERKKEHTYDLHTPEYGKAGTVRGASVEGADGNSIRDPLSGKKKNGGEKTGGEKFKRGRK